MSNSAFQKRYNSYVKQIEHRLQTLFHCQKPTTVYLPIRYILRRGGKRIRPVLVLISCEAVGGHFKRAIDGAVAIEILHNFTLVHDDIMDNADIRRGLPTIHRKWDSNVAILAGDGMVALSYCTMLKTKVDNLQNVLKVFTNAFIEVCEGQGYDKEFETRTDVCLNDYMSMIRKKTAALISASAEIGGLLGGGTNKEITALRKFGEYLGIAFQIKDDLLDIIGDENVFGKKIGGDVYEGKKTYLLLKALELVDGHDRKILETIKPGRNVSVKTVQKIREIYKNSGVIDCAMDEIFKYTQLAKQALDAIKQGTAKDMLLWIANELLMRRS